MTTFTLRWEGRRIVEREPEAATFPLRLRMQGPAGGYREARLRSTANPVVQRVRVTLTTRGRWTLSIAGWEYAPGTCAPPARVVVR